MVFFSDRFLVGALRSAVYVIFGLVVQRIVVHATN